MKKGMFPKLYKAVEGLMKCLKSHAIYLDLKCKYQKLHHPMDHPSATTPYDSCHFGKHIVQLRHVISSKLQTLQVALATHDLYEPLPHTPSDRKQRYK